MLRKLLYRSGQSDLIAKAPAVTSLRDEPRLAPFYCSETSRPTTGAKPAPNLHVAHEDEPMLTEEALRTALEDTIRCSNAPAARSSPASSASCAGA